MRRIIERVVTVVTTTTWTITLQEDPTQPGPANENLTQPQLPQNTQQSGSSDLPQLQKEDSHSEAKQ